MYIHIYATGRHISFTRVTPTLRQSIMDGCIDTWIFRSLGYPSCSGGAERSFFCGIYKTRKEGRKEEKEDKKTGIPEDRAEQSGKQMAMAMG